MAATKIPSPASVRRALTTLKRYGAFKDVETSMEIGLTIVRMELPNDVMSPKKTTRKKPKHKIVKPKPVFTDSSEKMSALNIGTFEITDKHDPNIPLAVGEKDYDKDWWTKEELEQ